MILKGCECPHGYHSNMDQVQHCFPSQYQLTNNSKMSDWEYHLLLQALLRKTVENKHSQTWTKIPAWNKNRNFYTFTGNLRMDGYVCIGTKNCQSVLSWKKTCQSLDLLTVIYIVHKQPIIGRMKWRSMF